MDDKQTRVRMSPKEFLLSLRDPATAAEYLKEYLTKGEDETMEEYCEGIASALCTIATVYKVKL